MSIVQHNDWDLSDKGAKDAERHQEKIDDSIRKNMKDVISEESIITRKRGKKVRIPVRGLKDYKFVHGSNDGQAGGVGQGKGKPGDIIDQQQKPGGDPSDGPCKEGEGSDYMEAEVDIDYLIQIMFEDLGLPWIEEKTRKEQLVPAGWKFETISKKGIIPRLHKKRTMMEAVKRMVMYVFEIMEETGCTEDEANRSLMQAHGDINDAIEVIKSGKLNGADPGVFIEDDDLRYKQIEPDMEFQSQAAVICMMDVSGSMTRDKKYLARSMLFWLTEFLKKCYDNVAIKFITHTTTAKVVDEETFFMKGESGGTDCGSAFDLANYIIDTEFPLDQWNVFCVYNSDGEDWDPKGTVPKMKEMLDKKVNMLAYLEIKPDENAWGWSNATLMKEIQNQWKFIETKTEGTSFFKNDEQHFLLGVIKDRSHVYPALKHMLFEKHK
jgi:sporulation protein YhbH